MCGIVGYIGRRDGVAVCLEGLHQLEYRGYDSAGLAVVRPTGLVAHKRSGRVKELEPDMPKRCKGSPAIGHTRWATHGEPTDENAHPHLDATGRIAVIHNGIIENAPGLRAKLEADGVVFASETDTEVVPHLLAAELDRQGERGDASLEEAVRTVLGSIRGAYGLAIISADHPDQIVVARNGSPVILGIGEREMLVASDTAALVRHTTQVVHLDDGDVAVLTADGYRTTTLDAREAVREPTTVTWGVDSYELAGHDHWLHQEIHTQPDAVARTLSGRLDSSFETAHLGGIDLTARDLLEIRRIKMLGCGSAFYAGMAGANLVESLARIPADAESASEFRYRNPVIEPDTLYVAVSQSGETSDTLAAVREVRRKGGRVLGVVNAVGSSIARECGRGVYLHAGPEVSVASTKTFTCTLVAFGLLALHLGRIRDLGPADGRRLIAGLQRLPDDIAETLGTEPQITEIAKRLSTAESMFFIGRNAGLPIALEGAQKLKEVSYIHAEAYPASELKHGPLALITPELPTVAFVPSDHLIEKNRSTLAEIATRKGPIIAVAHEPIAEATETIVIPRSEPELDSVTANIVMQLLAYHLARELGRDIDKPRNLAKSVTVE